MQIPQELKNILEKLTQAGYKAYIVGGCVRDLIMGRKPGDWDVTTNAKPEEIQKIFPDSFYTNQFGTVGIKTGSEDETLAVVEVTTFRLESKYTDKRHPDEVKFTNKLEGDLKRRDLTINAIALGLTNYPVTQLQITNYGFIDPFGGQGDIKNRIIRTVGNPHERFNEDALRMMRAIRLAVALDFEIEPTTFEAIKKNHELLKAISKERIRDELTLIINSKQADRGVELLRETGLLKYILPELLEGVDVSQNKHHIYTVWEHNLRALKYACEKNYSFEVRLASLLHDVGKPRTKQGEGADSTFYGHEIVGAHMAARVLNRLHFPKDQAEKIFKLVRYHLFYYNVGEVTESSVRRLVAKIGKENVEDLLKVREADRIGSGVPKAVPYKLRHLKFMIDKVARDPISPRMLKLNGDDIMKLLGLKPGIKVGMIIHALMSEVLNDPSKNNREYLEKKAIELNQLPEKKLVELGRLGMVKISEEEHKEVKKIKEKYFVK